MAEVEAPKASWVPVVEKLVWPVFPHSFMVK